MGLNCRPSYEKVVIGSEEGLGVVIWSRNYVGQNKAEMASKKEQRWPARMFGRFR